MWKGPLQQELPGSTAISRAFVRVRAPGHATARGNPGVCGWCPSCANPGCGGLPDGWNTTMRQRYQPRSRLRCGLFALLLHRRMHNL